MHAFTDGDAYCQYPPCDHFFFTLGYTVKRRTRRTSSVLTDLKVFFVAFRYIQGSALDLNCGVVRFVCAVGVHHVILSTYQQNRQGPIRYSSKKKKIHSLFKKNYSRRATQPLLSQRPSRSYILLIRRITHLLCE